MRTALDLKRRPDDWVRRNLTVTGLRTVLEGKTTLQEVMGSTSDVAYVPTKRRWEQILMHKGQLSSLGADVGVGLIQNNPAQ